jgi:outer membrane protein OmpA-like peptidoglycan-associated protein
MGETVCPFCLRRFEASDLTHRRGPASSLSRPARRLFQLLLSSAAATACGSTAQPPESSDDARTDLHASAKPRASIAPAPSASASAAPDPERGRMIAIYGETEVVILQVLRFAPGSTVVEKDAEPTLKAIVDILDTYPTMNLVVTGHADTTECHAAACHALAKKRAHAVVAALLERGAVEARLKEGEAGSDQPIDTNDNETNRAHNRRVEFKPTNPDGSRFTP